MHSKVTKTFVVFISKSSSIDHVTPLEVTENFQAFIENRVVVVDVKPRLLSEKFIKVSFWFRTSGIANFHRSKQVQVTPQKSIGSLPTVF